MKRWMLFFSQQVMLLSAIVLAGCESDRHFIADNDIMQDSIVHFVPTLYEQLSRADVASEELTDFYVTAYSNKFLRGDNIHYFKTGETWASSQYIIWPGAEVPISFWALSKDFESTIDPWIAPEEQVFDYTADPQNPEVLRIASYLNTNYKKMNGRVQLAFRKALASPKFLCIQAIQNVTILIKSISIHNLAKTGSFYYSKTTNSAGTWTIYQDKASDFEVYTQTFDDPITLNPDCHTSVAISDFWYLIPQDVYAWDPNDGGIDYADSDGNWACYTEIKCKMITNDTRLCIWGQPSGENEYESLYVPFKTNMEAMGYNQNITLLFDGGYMYNGQPFSPHDGVPLTYATWVKTVPIANPWIEKDPEDIIF